MGEPKSNATILLRGWRDGVVGFVFDHAVTEKRKCRTTVIDPHNQRTLRKRHAKSGRQGWVVSNNSAMLLRMNNEIVGPRLYDYREGFVMRVDGER